MFDFNVTSLNDTVSSNGRIPALIGLGMIEIIALVGNAVFIHLTVCGTRGKKSRTLVYMAYISLTNLGVALFVVPFPLVSLAAKKWILGAQMCYANGVLIMFCLTSNIYSMVILSTHKYFSIARPMFLSKSYKPAIASIASVVILSISVTIVAVANTTISFDIETGGCTTILRDSIKGTFFPYFLICSNYAVPTTVTSFCYWRTVVALRKHKYRIRKTVMDDEKAVESQRRLTRTLLLAFVIYIVSWTPFFVYGILYTTNLLNDSVPLVLLKKVAYMMGYLSCALNPLIYMWRKIFRCFRADTNSSSQSPYSTFPMSPIITTGRKISFSPMANFTGKTAYESHLRCLDYVTKEL